MDFIHEWKSKALDSGRSICSVHFAPEDFVRMYSFDQQCYQKQLKCDDIGVVPVPQFYRQNVEQRYSTRDRRLHCCLVRFISPLTQ